MMNSNSLADLEPRIVWGIFKEITKVPRPSREEEKIIAWVKNWAKENKITIKEDNVGNLVLSKKATKGKEKLPTLIIQGHLDMVCQTDPNSRATCEQDSLIVNTDGKTVFAEGTSLGADNGIGMAFGLAALVDEDLEHGPLEVLLTVDEETGLTGALALKKGFFTGDYLLNIDSEILGEITISSAGGGDTVLTLPVEKQSVKGWKGLRISIGGLKGGHSGIDINKNRLNALKIGVDALIQVQDYLEKQEDDNVKLLISNISGGTVRNAIADNFSCEFLVPKNISGMVQKVLKHWERTSHSIMKELEPKIKIEISEVKDNRGYSPTQSANIVSLLYELPHGVVSYSTEIEGLVQTSNNLAVVKSTDNIVEIAISTRSSVDQDITKEREKSKQIGEKYGAKAKLSEAYPGWQPNLESSFLKIVKESYEEVLGKEVQLRAIHAGLECGFFLKINPELQVSSIGPTIKNAHSTAEYVEVESVQKIWEVVKKIITSMDKLVK